MYFHIFLPPFTHCLICLIWHRHEYSCSILIFCRRNTALLHTVWFLLFFIFFLDFLMAPNSRPTSACSMVSALITSEGREGLAQGQCPVCGCQYDSGKQRKLVDTNCGHARCFKCMFAVEQCPLCQVCLRPNPGFEPGTTNHQSCISRESGFQSFNGSVSSVYSTTGKDIIFGISDIFSLKISNKNVIFFCFTPNSQIICC